MQKLKILAPQSAFSPLISITETETGKVYVIDISIPIFAAGHYTQAINVLLNATENDTVRILLNTPGGSVVTCIAMINAMERCKAKLITEVLGYAYSSGAYIWAFGKELRMGNFSRVMFHSSSHCDGGRTRDIKERAEAYEAGVTHLLKRVVANGILTEDEMKECLDGKRDKYFTYNDLKERIAKVGG